MSEYVVRWKHWRSGSHTDAVYQEWHNGTLSGARASYYANRDLLWSVFLLEKNDKPIGQHGGKTECRIYSQQIGCDGIASYSYLQLDAYGESICSWRDQFDRRVGRLYSLALALCELKENLSVKWYILTEHVPLTAEGVTHHSQVDKLFAAWTDKDIAGVKQFCAEIVQSWKQR